MTRRGVIIARLRPETKEKVAAIFAASDADPLPRIAGIRHRSLFLLENLYVLLIETDTHAEQAVDAIRKHKLFAEISLQLEQYVQPYNPATWRSPKDALAEEFYSWDATR